MRSNKRRKTLEEKRLHRGSEGNAPDRNEGQQLTWTKIAVLGGLLSTAILACQMVPMLRTARTSERSTELLSRPYIGLDKFSVYVDEKHRAISFNAVARNFGSFPGTNFEYGWVVTSNGKRIKGRGQGSRPDTLLPGKTATLIASVRDPSYERVLTGKDVVEFHVTSSYDGPAGHYTTCETSRFVPEYRAVEYLGPCEVT